MNAEPVDTAALWAGISVDGVRAASDAADSSLVLHLADTAVRCARASLLWWDPALTVETATDPAVGASLSVLGEGRVALALPPGSQALPLALQPGQRMGVAADRLLFVSAGARQRRPALLLAEAGPLVIWYEAGAAACLLALHGVGPAFAIALAAGEALDLSPERLLAVAATVHVAQATEAGIPLLRCRGPGTLYLCAAVRRVTID